MVASITYGQTVLAISAIWMIIRAMCWMRQKRIDFKREAILLLVYVCLVVVVRFTFFPFGKVDGKIQPLLFDSAKMLPLWVNFEPLVHLFEYPTKREVFLNVFGNTAMFIPLGIVWPAVFKGLNTHGKVIAAGVGISLCIELLQLLFYSRATDIDDLILNVCGFVIGYGIYWLVTRNKRRKSGQR